jgi:hypothetical protein
VRDCPATGVVRKKSGARLQMIVRRSVLDEDCSPYVTHFDLGRCVPRSGSDIERQDRRMVSEVIAVTLSSGTCPAHCKASPFAYQKPDSLPMKCNPRGSPK